MTNGIVALDIDGCLNSSQFFSGAKYLENPILDNDIDPDCVALLNDFTERYNLDVVISSDWRIDSDYQERLTWAGLKRIIDCTPITVSDYWKIGRYRSRGEEIQMWLDKHPEVDNYVIFDDRTDIEDVDHFVWINPYEGLTYKDILKASEIIEK